MTTFAVITPTIGSEFLGQCIDSLKDQDCIHHLFVDGEEYTEAVSRVIQHRYHKNLRVHYLRENLGKAGGDWYGHRIYAAASFLVNEDVLCYMDEDNWAGMYYIRAFEEALRGKQWAFTLRNIHDRSGAFLFPDNCESLGLWPIKGVPGNFHIDTSCFAIPRSVAVQIGHSWYGQYAADRQFFANLKHHFSNFACTKKHTVCYRLDGNPKSVTKEYFEDGNKIIADLYGAEEYPWHEQILVIKT